MNAKNTAGAVALAMLVLASHVTAGTLGSWASDANGFDTKSFWYDTGREVVVFDAQFTPAHAGQLIEAIRKSTASPITTLVITHPNPDKFNGAAAFRAIGASVVASRATADAIPGVHAYKRAYFVGAGMFTAATYPAQATVDRTFEGTLAVGGGEVLLHVLNHPGVARTQTIAHIPAQRALIVGDLVHHKAHAWLEGGIEAGSPRPDLAAWKAALAELRAFPHTTVHGGRGEAAPVEEAVAAQTEYLDALNDLVRGYLLELGPRVGELAGPEAGKHHQEIMRRAAEAYPQHGLAYLIQYGVYGLANALAQPASRLR